MENLEIEIRYWMERRTRKGREKHQQDIVHIESSASIFAQGRSYPM